MNKKFLTIFLVVIGIICCCMSVDAVEDPISVGIIGYRDFEYVEFEGPSMVNLSFVTSDIGQGLDMFFVSFYPSENITKYKFTSTELMVDSNFTPQINFYYYQDNNTGQIYMVGVDHGDVVVPLSNVEVLYQELLLEYDNLTSVYENFTVVFDDLEDEYQKISDTLSEYTNISGVDLSKVVKNLWGDYKGLNESFNDLEQVYSETLMDLNKTVDDYEDMENSFLLLQDNYTSLNMSYNDTLNTMMNISKNFSTYQAFVERINNPSATDGVYFEGTYYRPLGYYQQQIKNFKQTIEENNASGPAFIMLAVIITLVVCYIIARRYFNSLTGLIEPDDGFSENTHRFTKYVLLNKLKDSFSLKKKPQPVSNTNVVKPETLQNPSPSENNKPVGLEEKLEQYQNKTNEKIDTLHQDMTQLHSSIDQLLKQNGTPVGADDK